MSDLKQKEQQTTIGLFVVLTKDNPEDCIRKIKSTKYPGMIVDKDDNPDLKETQPSLDVKTSITPEKKSITSKSAPEIAASQPSPVILAESDPELITIREQLIKHYRKLQNKDPRKKTLRDNLDWLKKTSQELTQATFLDKKDKITAKQMLKEIASQTLAECKSTPANLKTKYGDYKPGITFNFSKHTTKLSQTESPEVQTSSPTLRESF